MFDRLFKIAKSYVHEAVAKGEEKFGFDNEDDDDLDFDEWLKKQEEKYFKKYSYEETKRRNREYDASGGGSYSGSKRSKRKKKSSVNKEYEYFKVLGIDKTSDFAVIKKQYRKMMKANHPDRFQNDEEKRKKAQGITARLNEAYAYLEKRYA